MATSTQNILTLGYSGKFANQVIFRSYGGRSVLSNVHDYSRKVWSQAQVDGRCRFRLAVKWAKEQLRDEKIKRYYRKRARGAQTATNVAIADYMKNHRTGTVECSNSNIAEARSHTWDCRLIHRNPRLQTDKITVERTQGPADHRVNSNFPHGFQ